jgi:methylglyoxal synthase
MLTWASDPSDDLQAYSIDPVTIHAANDVTLPINEQTIALIAHDNKKKDLLTFARDHFPFLLSFKIRIGTGTTARLLNGLIDEIEPDRLPPDQREELRPLCVELKQLIERAQEAKDLKQENFVRILLSGPKGGDVQIADMILTGACKTIFFFEDPSIARPHEQDIQLLERTGRALGKSVICVHDFETASDVSKKWRPAKNLSGTSSGELLLVSTALNRRFGVRSVVVASDDDPWASIREAASWYLLSAVAALAEERKKLGEQVRVTVSWGSAVAEIVDELPRMLKRLQEYDEQETAKRRRQDGKNGAVSKAYDLLGGRYFQPEKVTVGPMQGIMAATLDTAEANAVAQRLARFFRGKALELARSAVQSSRTPGRKVPAAISEHWSNTDILLTSCAPVTEEHARHVPSTAFGEHFREVAANSCGDVGAIFLNRRGDIVGSTRYRRIGMELDQIAMMRGRGAQSVLVVGAQSVRQEIALTVLEKGLMSVLITDLNFGRQLLRASLTSH